MTKDQRASVEREIVERCARVADRFIAMTEASPFWETRTTDCLRQIPKDIRKLALTPKEPTE